VCDRHRSGRPPAAVPVCPPTGGGGPHPRFPCFHPPALALAGPADRARESGHPGVSPLGSQRGRGGDRKQALHRLESRPAATTASAAVSQSTTADRASCQVTTAISATEAALAPSRKPAVQRDRRSRGTRGFCAGRIEGNPLTAWARSPAPARGVAHRRPDDGDGQPVVGFARGSR
jgi:hypothetical protein